MMLRDRTICEGCKVFLDTQEREDHGELSFFWTSHSGIAILKDTHIAGTVQVVQDFCGICQRAKCLTLWNTY